MFSDAQSCLHSAIHVAKFRCPGTCTFTFWVGQPTTRGHHGQTEIVTPGPTPAHHHFDCTHHSGDIWFAKIVCCFPVESCSRIDFQWCSTNASCSENPSASSLVPESATQTGRLSSFTAKTHQMTAESGMEKISNPPAQSSSTLCTSYKSIYLGFWRASCYLLLFYPGGKGIAGRCV
jgi:hypothetical protein